MATARSTPLQQRMLAIIAVTASAYGLVGCATGPAVSLADAAAAVQATQAQSLSFSGTGRWFQFGQAPVPGQAWPAFNLSRYSVDLDYAQAAGRVQITRQQQADGRERPAFLVQEVDQYVVGPVAWNRAPASGATTLQPAAVAERQAEIWATPQGFLKAALAHQATLHAAGSAGTEVSFTVDGKARYQGWLDAQGRVTQVRTWIDTPVLGDTLVETRFSDYRDFGGVSFPAHIVRSQGGHPVLDLNVTAVTLNPASRLSVPPEVASAKPAPVVVTATVLAPGVTYLTGGTHHSVLIEQKDHLVLVEAPLSEERSLALLEKIATLAPNKPLRYVINSHVHFDHSGGLRTFADAGATLVVPEGTRAYYEQAWAQPRSLNPDRLSRSGKPVKFETFRGKHVLSDGQRSIELHDIAGSGHSDAFALVYLPTEKVLIEADAYTPAAANAPAPSTYNPFIANLYANVQRLGLNVERIAALHGPRVVSVAELRAAASVPR